MSGFSALRFLVVDDNRHMRSIVASVLRSVGVKQIVEASDGADALDQLKAINPDIIITDFAMEPLNGLEFTRMIRTAKEISCNMVPIILMTAHSTHSYVVAARDAGVNEVLTKPVSASTIMERVCAVIDFPRGFVHSQNYVGPCRRRLEGDDYKGPFRRATDAAAREVHEA